MRVLKMSDIGAKERGGGPAGEKHWHGATPDSAFSHSAISIHGKTTF